MPQLDEVSLGEVYRLLLTVQQDLDGIRQEGRNDRHMIDSKNQELALKVGEIQLRTLATERGVNELWQSSRETRLVVDKHAEDARLAIVALDKALNKIGLTAAGIAGGVSVLAWIVPMLWKLVMKGP